MSAGDSHDSRPAAERLVPVRIETTFVEEESEPASLLRLVNAVLRRRRIVIGLPIVLATIVCSVTLLRSRTWTASASFSPSESQAAQMGQLAGIAAQFGFSIPIAASGESPEFYVGLLRSGEIRRSAVRSTYRLVDETQPDTTWITGNLVELFEIRGRSEAGRLDGAVEQLGRRMSVGTTPETGVVRLSVQTRWPELSVQVAGRLLELVNEFNLQTRQSQANAEREFVAQRLVEARSDLAVAEETLQGFLQSNRRIENSPQLGFERDRLQRVVTLRQEVVISLAQALEQAKIEEVRNTPVITIVEQPYPPAKPDRRRLIMKGLVSLALGLFLGIVAAFAIEFMGASRDRDPELYEEFRQLTAATKRDARGLWGRLRRRGPAGRGQGE
jgi:uncharacterized protein involved in exopolysaccharide biosynthesis